MENLKFRVWDTEENKWGSETALEVFECGGKLSYLYDGDGDHTIIQQFTGFLDKTGKEIYEGDIVVSSKMANNSSFKGPFLIRWNKFLANYALDMNGKDYKTLKGNLEDLSSMYINLQYKDMVSNFANLTGLKAKSLTIIGNIFENPGLINENN